MSKKSWFGSRKTAPKVTTITPSSPIPRVKSEIDKDYTAACAQAGQIQYRIESAKDQLNKINNLIHRLNTEADERAKLDAEEKAKAISETVPEQGTTNV